MKIYEYTYCPLRTSVSPLNGYSMNIYVHYFKSMNVGLQLSEKQGMVFIDSIDDSKFTETL